MEIGAVLSEAWELYRRFFVRFVLTAAAVFVVLDLVGALIDTLADDNVLALVVWGVIGLVVTIVGTFWVQGALVEAVRDVRDGRADSGIGELYSRVGPILPALIAAGVVAGIAVGIGLLLLIVPGLYLLTRLSLVVPVIVLERTGAGKALTRSGQLVRGHGWQMFGLIVVTILGAAIVGGVIGGLFEVLLPDFVDTWIGGVVADSLTVPFVALAWTLAYYRLSGRSDVPAAAAA